jgi:hypothetical protein
MDIEKIILPLSPKEMVEFFKDKEKIYYIDYKKTKESMSAKNMLVYLGNLQIICEFDYIDCDLIKAYLTLKDVTNILDLNYFLANVLYYNKYKTQFVEFDDFVEIFEELCKTHQDIINHYCEILNSSLLFMLSNSVPELINDKRTYEGIHDQFGFAFLKLYSITDFLLVYLEKVPALDKQIFFDMYFDNKNFMFNGTNLFSHFAVQNNAYFQLIVNISRVNDLMHGAEMTEDGQDAINRLRTIHTAYDKLAKQDETF